MVEHDLAKVGVAGSSPVFRSRIPTSSGFFFARCHSSGGTGRHVPIKIGIRSKDRVGSIKVEKLE